MSGNIFKEALEDALDSTEATKNIEQTIDFDLTQEQIDGALIVAGDNPFDKFEKNMKGIFITRLNNAMLHVSDAKFLSLFGKYAEYILPKKTRIENTSNNELKEIQVTIKKQIDHDDELFNDLMNNTE